MTLFLAMLPFYLAGNLHCVGMCGPLVAMLGQHRYRYAYFFGRISSFAMAGLLAGALGAVINLVLDKYHIPSIVSLICGVVILILGIHTFMGWQYPGYERLARFLAPLTNRLSLLMLKDRPWPVFLFGFSTILLPCGQTLIVFSACALFGDPMIGFLNGLAFALITSPALLFAMHVHRLLSGVKRHYNKIIGGCTMVIGLLAVCRGLADVGIIPHFVLSPGLMVNDHIVLF